jgi:hypothetical protein
MVTTHFYARGALHEKLTTHFMYQPNLRDYRALHVTLLTSIKTIPLVLKTLLLILLISIRETVYTY